jgi:hypothetical protein
MDREAFKEKLRILYQKCQAELDEVRSRFEVSYWINWFGIFLLDMIIGIRK